MSNPQKENGYTAIANEILEALAQITFRGCTRQVLDVIFRKTYGFHKKEDAIALSQFCKLTKASKRTVIYAIQELEAKNMIFVKKDGTEANIYRFNKHHDTWLVQNSAPQVLINRNRAKVTSAKLRTGAKLPPKLVQNYDQNVKSFAHTKETTKETKDIATTQVVAVVHRPLKREPKPPIEYSPEMLEERLMQMESNEGSALDIIATYIREKPVKITNSKQLSLVIGRFARIAKASEGAYTNAQILGAIDDIKKDNKERTQRGQSPVDWTVETIIKTLIKK